MKNGLAGGGAGLFCSCLPAAVEQSTAMSPRGIVLARPLTARPENNRGLVTPQAGVGGSRGRAWTRQVMTPSRELGCDRNCNTLGGYMPRPISELCPRNSTPGLPRNFCKHAKHLLSSRLLKTVEVSPRPSVNDIVRLAMVEALNPMSDHASDYFKLLHRVLRCAPAKPN